ncbi:VOC family protein [Shewanella marisflavi]|uniref:Glyoxalase n=1 Tax=Shewanella marisflavi TaxID=260364 RepID=A0AAC9TYJ4_9GAMM|nr:VOC family protein [Shewanella marisflavi]ASJ97215.1 glyoxalase [Shewanella marisflavi]MCL1043545.1 VOC family protein [Shewanella marisflavi]
MNQNLTINYIEIPVKDIAATKAFFSKVFNWQFEDYGPEYSCFTNAGIAGGFYLSDKGFNIASGAPLIVIYAKALEVCLTTAADAGALITQEIFSFPGGRRFHFKDPNGNEFAVWSE